MFASDHKRSRGNEILASGVPFQSSKLQAEEGKGDGGQNRVSGSRLVSATLPVVVAVLMPAAVAVVAGVTAAVTMAAAVAVA